MYFYLYKGNSREYDEPTTDASAENRPMMKDPRKNNEDQKVVIEIQALLEGLAAGQPLPRPPDMCELAKAANQFQQTLEARERISRGEVGAWSRTTNAVLQHHINNK